MPIYEYECAACDYRFERRQGFHEEPISVCPICQGRSRRILHPTPIIFKGSGFYITDNRKDRSPESTEGQERAESKKDEGAPAKSG